MPHLPRSYHSKKTLCIYRNIEKKTIIELLEQLTSFPQTTFPPAAGSINLHPTINQINATVFAHDLKEIKTDQIALTLLQLCHPKVSKCCCYGNFLKPNNVIPETPNDLVFVSNAFQIL